MNIIMTMWHLCLIHNIMMYVLNILNIFLGNLFLMIYLSTFYDERTCTYPRSEKKNDHCKHNYMTDAVIELVLPDISVAR